MKLHDYFAEQRSKSLSQQEKLAVYNKFLSQRVAITRPSFMKRMYSFRYVFSAVFVFVLAFGSYYSMQPNLMSDLFFWRESVQAVNIAQIIQAQGMYTIQSADNRKVVGTNIHDGDVIGVEEGSFVEVKISKSHKAKIPGPASFQIVYAGQKTDGVEEYRLKMLSSNYVAIESIEAEEISPEAKSKQENLVLVTDDGLVINDTKTKKSVKKKTDQVKVAVNTTSEVAKTRFVVQKKQGKSVIDNAGTEDVIVTRETEKTAVVVIPDKTVASVGVVQETSTEIQAIVAGTIEELEELEQSISTGSMTTGVIDTGMVTTWTLLTGVVVTWTVNIGSTSTGVVVTGSVMTGKVNTGTITQTIGEESVKATIEPTQLNTERISEEVKTIKEQESVVAPSISESEQEVKEEIIEKEEIRSDEKFGGLNTDELVFTEDQLYAIQQHLNGALLMGYVEKLTVAYLGANSPKVTTQRSNIMATLNATYEVINKDNPYTKNTGTDIVNAANNLKKILEDEGVKQGYTHNLSALVVWLNVVYSFEAWAFADSGDTLTFQQLDTKLELTKRAGISFK